MDQERKAFKSMAKNIAVVVVSIFLTVPILLVIDYLVGLALPGVEDKYLPVVSREAREDSPAYSGFDWYGPEFLDEAWNPARRKHTKLYYPLGIPLLIPTDYKGKYINSEDGVRHTRNPYRGSGNPVKIFVVGGSTVFCSESADAFTLPSLICEQWHNAFPEQHIEVSNLGTTGSVSYQDFLRVLYEIQRQNVPDVLIVYNGINDANHGTYHFYEMATMFQRYKKYKALEEEKKERVAVRIKRALASTNLARLFVARQGFFERNARVTATQYFRNLMMMESLSRMYGFETYFFLQPHIFSGKPLTVTEQKLALGTRKTYPGLKQALMCTYRHYGREAEKWPNPRFRDFGDVFGNSNEDIFIDYCHISPKGGLIVSRQIVDHIHSSKVKANEQLQEYRQIPTVSEGIE